ncbi:hypothetical protein VTN02DRAFT_6876 [Thermoascus thermophilus]
MTTLLFTTPELLERILLHLDLRTLLTAAQRVCRAWTRLIASSPALQRALFFRPVPYELSGNNIVTGKRKRKKGEKVYNPLLAELFPPFFPRPTTPNRLDQLDLDLDLARNPTKQAAYLRRDASWRRMLVQQPPARSLSYIRVSQARGGQSWARFTIPVPGPGDSGLRMNMLYDLLLLLGPGEVLWWGQLPMELAEEDLTDEDDEEDDDKELKRVFSRAATASDIAIYTTRVVQCAVGGRRKQTTSKSPDDETSLRFPYEDWGSVEDFVGVVPDEEGPGSSLGLLDRSRARPSRETMAEIFGPEVTRDQAILVSLGGW